MGYEIRRGVVLLFAVVMFGVAVTNLAASFNYSVVHFVGSALVAALALYGAYGAFTLSHTHLKVFTVLLAATWCYLLVYSVINVVTLSITHAFMDIVLMGVVFFGTCVSADLTWCVGNDDAARSGAPGAAKWWPAQQEQRTAGGGFMPQPTQYSGQPMP